MFARSVVIVALLAQTALAERSERGKPRPQDDDLRELTNDPILGRADRVDGEQIRGLVAFTFDDGPEPATTPTVIDALQRYNIPATFFIVAKKLVGKASDEPRAILKRQLEAGFLVASHTVSHKNLRRPRTDVRFEIDESIRILAKEAQRPIGMFRAPFGSIDKRGRALLKARGLTEVFWSVDTRDWETKDPEQLRRNIFEMIMQQHGGVVLMHDVKQITADIVANVFDDLEAENCRRLDIGGEPIIPVSLHYFLRDKKKLRDIPADVKQTTAAYRTALPARCFERLPGIDLLRPIFWDVDRPAL